MARLLFAIALSLALLPAPAAAQKSGTAGGKGKMIYWANPKTMEKGEVAFAPKVSWAYVDSSSPAGKRINVVLTATEAPLAILPAAKGHADARRKWCQEKKVSFVALELNDKGGVELLHQCANGHFGTEMVSTINGLDSVVVKLDVFNGKQIKGTLRGGEGSCDDQYCEQTEDYVFDAPLN